MFEIIFLLLVSFPALWFLQIAIEHERIGWRFSDPILYFLLCGYAVILLLIFLLSFLIHNESQNSRVFRRRIRQILKNRLAQLGIATAFLYMAIEYQKYPIVGNVNMEESSLKENLNYLAGQMPAKELDGSSEGFYSDITGTDYITDNISLNVIYGGKENSETIRSYLDQLLTNKKVFKVWEFDNNQKFKGGILDRTDNAMNESLKGTLEENNNILSYVNTQEVINRNPIIFSVKTDDYSCYEIKYKLTFVNLNSSSGNKEFCSYKYGSAIKITPDTELATNESTKKVSKLEFWVVSAEKDKSNLTNISEVAISTAKINVETNFCIEGYMNINSSRYSKILATDKVMDGYAISNYSNLEEGKCVDSDMW